MRAFADLADLPEDERIVIMVKTAKDNPGQIIGVAVDDEDAKVERYRCKLEAGGLRIIDVKPGPVKGVRLIRVTYRGN